jgi:hypothetical protein
MFPSEESLTIKLWINLLLGVQCRNLSGKWGISYWPVIIWFYHIIFSLVLYERGCSDHSWKRLMFDHGKDKCDVSPSKAQWLLYVPHALTFKCCFPTVLWLCVLCGCHNEIQCFPKWPYSLGGQRQCNWLRHYATDQKVEALCYKPEGCGFSSHWGNLVLQLT